MLALPDDLARIIQDDLPTRVVGRPITHYERIGSTNDLVKAQARSGHAEGLVVLAEEQTAGRGRMGRGWTAPPGSSLLMSLLLRPTWLPPADAFTLTMLAGVVLCEAVEQVAPIRAALKWPNDLLLPVAAPGTPVETPGLRKAAGVLSELELKHDQLAWAVIGMGINVDWAPSGIVDGRDLARVATSVSIAAGRPIARGALLRALLIRLDARYLALREGQREALFADWRARLAMLGQRVYVQRLQGGLHGIAEDVEPSGALRVRDASGVMHVVLAGDVGVVPRTDD
jgi:BirA family biotin operon repressor/biotin-[acetyl-CoA-carboxylase] ligase